MLKYYKNAAKATLYGLITEQKRKGRRDAFFDEITDAQFEDIVLQLEVDRRTCRYFNRPYRGWKYSNKPREKHNQSLPKQGRCANRGHSPLFT